MGSDVALTWSCLGGYANTGPRERVEGLDWLRLSIEEVALGSCLPAWKPCWIASFSVSLSIKDSDTHELQEDKAAGIFSPQY